MPRCLGVHVPAPPGCTPVGDLHQHDRGEVVELLQAEVVRAQQGFGRTLVEHVLRPGGGVLAQRERGTLAPLGGQLRQRVQYFLGAGLQGRLLPQFRHDSRRGLPAVLGHVLFDEPVLHLLDPLGSVTGAGGAAGELRQQRRGHIGDLPAGVAVLAAIHRHPRHSEQPGGVIGQEGVVGL